MERYDKYELCQNPEYMFADKYTETAGLLRLECPSTGGGNLGGWRGCRTSAGLMAHPEFEPKAIIFYIGTVGSYGRGLYYVHRFDLDQSGFYVRDVTPGGKPREYSRRNPKTDIYDTVIFLIPVEVEQLGWTPPPLL